VGAHPQDLVIDFAMTKWHAKRLIKTVEVLRGMSTPPLASSQQSQLSVSGSQALLPNHLLGASNFIELPPANGAVDRDGDDKKRDKKKRDKKKAATKKKKKRKERARIEKEWAKLRQEREKLALERQAEAEEKGKKTIADLEFRELSVADIEWDNKVIAHGRFGVVYRGRWRGVECALKQLRVDVSMESQEMERLLKAFKKEASLMQGMCACLFFCSHLLEMADSVPPQKKPWATTPTASVSLVPSHLVAAFASSPNGQPMVFPASFLPKTFGGNRHARTPGSVYDLLIRKKKDLPFKILVKLARDAACGILHLHSEKVLFSSLLPHPTTRCQNG